MKFLRKSLACLLAFGCIGALASCGGGDKGPVQTDYTVELSVFGGEKISGIDITLTQGETEVATGKTDENGQFSGVALEGDYTVELGLLPEEYGYLFNRMIDVSLSKNDPVIEVEIGSQTCPRLFVAGETGKADFVLPANTTHYYVVSRPMGRPLVIEDEGVEVIYGGNTYAPQDGKISITFASEETNSFAVEYFAVANKTDAEKTVTLCLYEERGSSAKPIYIENLGETLTATVQTGKIVYYTYTATGTGTLTVESATAGNSLYMFNANTQEVTAQQGNSVSLAVNEGDVISVQITVDDTVEAEETQVQFSLSFAENVVE